MPDVGAHVQRAVARTRVANTAFSMLLYSSRTTPPNASSMVARSRAVSFSLVATTDRSCGRGPPCVEQVAPEAGERLGVARAPHEARGGEARRRRPGRSRPAGGTSRSRPGARRRSTGGTARSLSGSGTTIRPENVARGSRNDTPAQPAERTSRTAIDARSSGRGPDRAHRGAAAARGGEHEPAAHGGVEGTEPGRRQARRIEEAVGIGPQRLLVEQRDGRPGLPSWPRPGPRRPTCRGSAAPDRPRPTAAGRRARDCQAVHWSASKRSRAAKPRTMAA